MNDQFIILTKTESTPIIIGINSIAAVWARENSEGCILMFNYPKGDSSSIIWVDESFETIKMKLGLTGFKKVERL